MDHVLAGFFAEIAQAEVQASPTKSDGNAFEPPPEEAPAVEAEVEEEEEDSGPAHEAAVDGPLSPEALMNQIALLKQQQREAKQADSAATAAAAPRGPPTVTLPPAPAPSSAAASASASQPAASSSRPPFNPALGLAYGVRPPIMNGPPQLATPMFGATTMYGPPTVLPPMSGGNTVTIGGLPVLNPIISTSAALPRRHRHNAKSDNMFYRVGAGKVWEDDTLKDWPDDDFRIFAGNLGNDVNVDTLSKAFSRYPSFQKAKVIRDPRTNKTKGYGFVSFGDSQDMIRALKEMNNKYVGNRPVMLRASKWKDRACDPEAAKEVIKDQKATGWEQKKKRRYHVNLEPLAKQG
nr:RNA-binding motif protein 42 [Euglena gracilis]